MHRAISAVSLLLAIAVYPRGASADTALEAKERDDAFAWFSTLGYSDIRQAQLARAAWGWSLSKEKSIETLYLHGFVTDEEQLTLVGIDLSRIEFRHWQDLMGRPSRPEYEIVDLAQFVATLLKETPASEQIGDRLSLRGQLFLLAWVCHERGYAELAEQLYDRSARVTERWSQGLTFRQRLAEDFATSEMWRGIESFGQDHISREVLLASFQRIVKTYPESRHAARARETSDLLTKMIQEDREHAEASKNALPVDRRSRHEQIAELIFRLRDQNSHQHDSPGFLDIFAYGKNSPAHQLVDIGYDAVPQLINALGDDRFTRSVSYHRAFAFSHTVLRVHDCVLRILERIAGRTFRTTKFDDPTALKADVAEWYAKILQKGERQVGLEGIEGGDRNSPELARRLLSTDPEAASAALLVGVRKATEAFARTELTELVGKQQGQDALAFLLDEVVHGPYGRARLAAATALQDRGRPEGVDAMIAEWENGNIGRKDEWSSLQEAIVAFLAWSNELRAIESLERTFAQRPVDDRLRIVQAFRRGHSKSGRSGHPRDAACDHTSPETKRAIRTLLLRALDDTEERKGTSGSYSGQRFSDPRICDMAGYVLSTIDSEKYPFRLSADFRDREQARWALKVVLQSEQ